MWAVGASIAPEVIAFLRFRPELLCAFDPTADLTNSPLLRTWHQVMRRLAPQINMFDVQNNLTEISHKVSVAARFEMEADMQEAFIVGWPRRPDLSGGHLISLRDLNQRFLDLVSVASSDWRSAGRLELPADASERLARLSALQRAATASCPYALFDLKFQDHEHWLARFSHAAADRVADDPGPGETTDFVRLALFFAWHVAITADLAGRLFLGMSERSAAAFRGARLNRLLELAASESAHLTARWRASGAYWNSLLQAASGSDPGRLRRVQLFGLQLAAAARLQ